jgi:hypothetical protein
MNKPVTKDVAVQEIEGWLEKKRIYDSQKENNKAEIELLIDAVMRGDLVLDEKGEFTHTLNWPLEDIKEIKYKARLNDTMLKRFLNGVKATDGEGRFMAHAQCLTNQPKAILESLDSIDKKLMTSIVVFFI